MIYFAFVLASLALSSVIPESQGISPPSILTSGNDPKLQVAHNTGVGTFAAPVNQIDVPQPPTTPTTPTEFAVPQPVPTHPQNVIIQSGVPASNLAPAHAQIEVVEKPAQTVEVGSKTFVVASTKTLGIAVAGLAFLHLVLWSLLTKQAKPDTVTY